jgi:hypothetical protein
MPWTINSVILEVQLLTGKQLSAPVCCPDHDGVSVILSLFKLYYPSVDTIKIIHQHQAEADSCLR